MKPILTPQAKLQILRDLDNSVSLGFMRALTLFEELLSKTSTDKQKEFENILADMKEQIKNLNLKDGYTPKKFVDYFTPEEIKQITKSATPVNGKDYLTPEEVSAMHGMIAEKVRTMIEVKHGITPSAGIDYPTFQQVKDMITEMFMQEENSEDDINENGTNLLEEIKKKFNAVEITGENIVQKINTLPIKPEFQINASHIIGLPRLQKGKDGKRYLHGGGDTVIAGTGVTIVTNTNGTKTISSSGGGAFPQLTQTQINALTPINGQTAYNTTNDTPQIYIAGAWYLLQVTP